MSLSIDPVLNGLKDNIADEEVSNIAMMQPAKEADDEYLKRFDSLDQSNTYLRKIVDSLDRQPHDEARVRTLKEIVKVQQKVNEDLYDLLVEMNNFFGGRV